jgi:hypothetical protein
MSKPKKPKQVTISRRDAKLAGNLPIRTQYHGDEPVKACDLRITGIMLTAGELCAMLREPDAHKALFVRRAGMKLDDPLLKRIAPLKLEDRIDSAEVVLFTGLDGVELRLGMSKLKGITLEPKEGGLTEMSCLVQATPTLDKRIATLVDQLDAGVQIEIRYEHNAEQPELAMSGEKAKGGEEGEKFEQAAKAQVDAFNRGRKGDRPDAH